MKKDYILIKNDVFNINSRVKHINLHYFIVFNKKTKSFEIHNNKYRQHTFEFSLPYKQLDMRAIKHVYKMLNYNQFNIESLIKSHNEKIQLKSQEKLLDEANYKFNEIYKYANSSKEFDDNLSYKNVWS